MPGVTQIVSGGAGQTCTLVSITYALDHCYTAPKRSAVKKCHGHGLGAGNSAKPVITSLRASCLPVNTSTAASASLSRALITLQWTPLEGRGRAPSHLPLASLHSEATCPYSLALASAVLEVMTTRLHGCHRPEAQR